MAEHFLPLKAHSGNLTSNRFHHKPSVSRITDFYPVLYDNRCLIGAVKR